MGSRNIETIDSQPPITSAPYTTPEKCVRKRLASMESLDGVVFGRLPAHLHTLDRPGEVGDGHDEEATQRMISR